MPFRALCLVCAETSRGQCYAIVLQPLVKIADNRLERTRIWTFPWKILSHEQTSNRNIVKHQLEMLVSKDKSKKRYCWSVAFRISTFIWSVLTATQSVLKSVDKQQGQSIHTCFRRYIYICLALGNHRLPKLW